MSKKNKNRTIKFLRFQLPAIIWMSAIFVQSSFSSISTPDLGFDLQDKLGHMLEYAILAILLLIAFSDNVDIAWQKNKHLWTLVIGSLYGVSDEIHQYFVPGRMADLNDVIADILGVLIVLAVYLFWKRKKQRSSKNGNSGHFGEKIKN